MKPRSTEAYEGDNIVILCEVIGDPKPEVVWLRDFLKVSQSYQRNKKIVILCLPYTRVVQI